MALSGWAALWAARSARTASGVKGSMSLVRSAARRCSTRMEGPTPQDMAYLSSVCSRAGPATPMWSGRCDAGGGEAVGPGDDRGGLEDELGGDGHRGVGLAGEGGLGARARPWRGLAAVGVDVAVALRVAGDVQAGEAAGVEAAGAEELQRLGEGAARAGDAAGDDQRLADAGVGVGGEAGVELGRGGDAAGGDVRHDGEALVHQAAGGGDHVGDRCRRCGRRRRGCRRAGGRGSRRPWRRSAASPRWRSPRASVATAAAGGAAGAAARRTKSRIFAIRVLRSGSQGRGVAQPSLAIRALIASGLNSASSRAASPEATSAASPSTR